jgi:hypothetical protein
MLQDTNIGNGFLSKTPIAQGKKSTNRKIWQMGLQSN